MKKYNVKIQILKTDSIGKSGRENNKIKADVKEVQRHIQKEQKNRMDQDGLEITPTLSRSHINVVKENTFGEYDANSPLDRSLYT
eukprot:UN08988